VKYKKGWKEFEGRKRVDGRLVKWRKIRIMYA
jgi:hypothetical protein